MATSKVEFGLTSPPDDVVEMLRSVARDRGWEVNVAPSRRFAAKSHHTPGMTKPLKVEAEFAAAGSGTRVVLTSSISGIPLPGPMQYKRVATEWQDTLIDEDRRRRAGPPVSALSPSRSEPTEQLRKLGELRDAGVVTDVEFEAKKREILGRI